MIVKVNDLNDNIIKRYEEEIVKLTIEVEKLKALLNTKRYQAQRGDLS